MGLAQRVRDYMSGDDYEYEYEDETLNYAAEESRSGYDVPVSYTHLDVYKRQP